MNISVDEVVEGEVTKVVSYGAFVSLPGGKRGLIHISEIADTFIKDVGDYLKERQAVQVKVLSISPDGRKIDLSFKQVNEPAKSTAILNQPSRTHANGDGTPGGGIEELYRQIKHPKTQIVEGARGVFEEKLAKFLKTSDEKLSDVKRNLESKRGGGRY